MGEERQVTLKVSPTLMAWTAAESEKGSLLKKGFLWRELQGMKNPNLLLKGEGGERGRSAPYLKSKGRTLREPPSVFRVSLAVGGT